ncbi:interleukin-1 beta-like [Eleutherodactylus coqui]|uniref:interleukin-1 beta-like n=1 Tax=Eleutherodactylus coqui TaxID=57060 RepID=UPI003462FD15
MAEVPDLSDLPMDVSENDEEFYANDVPNKMKASKHLHCHENRVTCLPKIKLDIRKPEKLVRSYKKVFTAVAETLKESGGSKSQCLIYDDDLLTPGNENVTVSRVDIKEAAPLKFAYNSTSQHNIRDSNDKALIMEGNDSIVAVYLEGENVQLELKINMNTYIEPHPDSNKRPVTLGIVGHNLYLCCTAEEGVTSGVLRLTEVDDIKSKENELLPFIFYCRISSNLSTFESAAFPGYYLSTSPEEREKLQIRPDDQMFLTTFQVS